LTGFLLLERWRVPSARDRGFLRGRGIDIGIVPLTHTRLCAGVARNHPGFERATMIASRGGW